MTFQAGFSGPLYQQVHENLKSKITTGEWKGGMAIPGDAELSRQLGVSIGTVRKALDELARQRLVVRERGRGTFIKDPSTWCADLDGWMCDGAGCPVDAEIDVVEATTGQATGGEQRLLQMVPDRRAAPRVHRLVRVWRHRGQRVCAERLIVSATRLPHLLEEADLTAPALTDIYMRHLRRGIGRTVWTISACVSDAALDGLLDEEGGADGEAAARFACRRVVCDGTDRPIELSSQLLALGDNVLRISR